MSKIYTKPTAQSEQLTPKKETIEFLLNYSKALRVDTYDTIQFETLLN